MLCRRSFRTEVASGPYCVSRSSRRMTVAVNCLTRFVFWSNVVFADAINRPSTSAVSVPIRPAGQISARTQATKSIDSSYLRMLHHLGDYADPSSDFAGLSKDPFLTPSSTRTGRGAYVAYGSKGEILTASRCFPLCPGGPNRSTQHFILKERWSGLDGSKIS